MLFNKFFRNPLTFINRFDKEKDFNKEAVRKHMIINLFTLVGLSCMIAFGIKHFIHGDLFLAGFLTFSLIFVLFTLFFLRKTRKYNTAGWFIVLIMYIILIVLLFGGNPNRLLWYYVFPALSYFVLGIKRGGLINLSLILITGFVFLFSFDFLNALSTAFKIRFLTSYLAVSIMAHIFEFVRYRAYTSLRNAHHKISDYLDETIAQKEKIERQAAQLAVINEELKKLTVVVQETGNAVLIMEKGGKVEWVNDGFTALYDYNIFDLNEAYNWDLIHASFNEKMEEMALQAMENRKSVTFESIITSRDGQKVEVQTTLTPLVDDSGEVKKLIAIDTDIRRLKNAERQMKQLVDMKDRFFSIIAHDLKNPFNSLLGVSRLLVDKFDQYDKERKLEFLRNIYKVSKQSYELLVNLLEWSRSQTGRMNLYFEKLPLHEIVEENVHLLQSVAKEKQIKIVNKTPKDTLVHGDKNTLNTVFRNLISNSVKFSYPDSQVSISAELQDDKVVVKIIDQGVGIPVDKIPKLFMIDQNYSTKGTNSELGTGLGLILCKEFVEKNGGTINVESELGRGSVFSFTLYKAD